MMNRDVKDAIEHYLEAYGGASDGSIRFLTSTRRMPLAKILDWEDVSGWLEVERGEWKDDQDALLHYRGPAWGKRALSWIKDKRLPPIVLIDGKLARCIGDGRGRVNLAVAMGLPSLEVVLLKEDPEGTPFPFVDSRVQEISSMSPSRQTALPRLVAAHARRLKAMPFGRGEWRFHSAYGPVRVRPIDGTIFARLENAKGARCAHEEGISTAKGDLPRHASFDSWRKVMRKLGAEARSTIAPGKHLAPGSRLAPHASHSPSDPRNPRSIQEMLGIGAFDPSLKARAFEVTVFTHPGKRNASIVQNRFHDFASAERFAKEAIREWPHMLSQVRHAGHTLAQYEVRSGHPVNALASPTPRSASLASRIARRGTSRGHQDPFPREPFPSRKRRIQPPGLSYPAGHPGGTSMTRTTLERIAWLRTPKSERGSGTSVRMSVDGRKILVSLKDLKHDALKKYAKSLGIKA